MQPWTFVSEMGNISSFFCAGTLRWKSEVKPHSNHKFRTAKPTLCQFMTFKNQQNNKYLIFSTRDNQLKMMWSSWRTLIVSIVVFSGTRQSKCSMWCPTWSSTLTLCPGARALALSEATAATSELSWRSDSRLCWSVTPPSSPLFPTNKSEWVAKILHFPLIFHWNALLWEYDLTRFFITVEKHPWMGLCYPTGLMYQRVPLQPSWDNLEVWTRTQRHTGLLQSAFLCKSIHI